MYDKIYDVYFVERAVMMKRKLLSFFLAVIICFASVVPSVYASVSLGYFSQFTVSVSAQMGSVLYFFNQSADGSQVILRPSTICIPTKTMLIVTDEIEYNGTLFLGVTYRGEDGYIKRTDVNITKPIVGGEATFNTQAKRTVVVANKDGISLRNGPSFAYSTVGEVIPYGTKLSYDKVNCATEYDSQWAYTKHNNVAGWIYIYPYGLPGKASCAGVLDENSNYTGVILTISDGVFLTENADEDSAKVAENIPANTVFSFKYYCENYDSISAYVEYNGVKGWLKTRGIGYKTATGVKGGVYVLNENGIPFYKNANSEEEPVATVPANANLCVDYLHIDTNGVAMHTKYNGDEGWLISSNVNDYIFMENAYDVEVKKADGIDLYENLSKNAEIKAKIPQGTVLTCSYETSVSSGSTTYFCNYVEYNGNYGWIIATNEEAEFIDGSQRQLDAPLGAKALKRMKPENAPEFDDTVSDPTEEENGLSTAQIIIICVAGAAVIAAAAFIIIKKKRNK